MDENVFWALIDETRSPDPAEHSERLVAELVRRGPDDADAFDRLWHERHIAAYRWDLWAAAYEIQGGCSDDCFSDFRDYVISLGRDVYERALQDPDSLADVDIDPATEFEDIAYVGLTALEKLGHETPPHEVPEPDDPAGEKWDEDSDGSAKVVPRLAAKYGGGG